MSRRLISIVTPCYNEEGNVEELYRQIKQVFAALPQYDYEHLYIDNSSQDATVDKLRRLAAQDQRVKVILNARNFGHIRSPYHALLQSTIRSGPTGRSVCSYPGGRQCGPRRSASVRPSRLWPAI